MTKLSKNHLNLAGLLSLIVLYLGYQVCVSIATALAPILGGNYSNIGLLAVLAFDIVAFIFTTVTSDGGFKALVLPSFYTFALALAAGIGEEAMFGAVPVAMMKNKADDKRIITTVILTGFLFGTFHFSNMSQGAIFSTTLLQVISATVTGVLYAAIYLRSGSIALPMFVHFFHDLLNFMIPAQATGIMTQTTFTAMELIPEFGLMAIELAVAIYLLRKVNFEGIKETWKNKWSEQ